ncbi:MAG: hypothetical protein ACK5O2_04470 [Microthrixaceae bacterium]
MAAPLYPEPRLAISDGGFLHVPGPPAGPAGASTVELPGGELWLVDHVDPARAVSIEARRGDPLSPLLVAAYGGDGAMFLQDRAQPLGDDMDADPAWMSKLQPGPIRYAPGTRAPIDLGAARQAGASALLADLLDDAGRHPLSRLTAALSITASLPGSQMSEVLRALAAGLPDRSSLVFERFDFDDLWSLGEDSIRELLELVDLASTVDPSWRPVTGDLARALDDLAEPVQIAASMAAPADEHAEPFPQDLVSAPQGTLEDLGEQGRTVLEWLEPGVVVVSVQRGAPRRWVRVLRRDGLVLLGQAPLRRRGLVDRAEVLVPADIREDELNVTVVDEAEARGTNPGPAESIRLAVSAGRDAARAQRLGMVVDASERWRECARLWAAAGDRVREDQALDLADRPLLVPLLSDPVVDRIEEELGAS